MFSNKRRVFASIPVASLPRFALEWCFCRHHWEASSCQSPSKTDGYVDGGVKTRRRQRIERPETDQISGAHALAATTTAAFTVHQGIARNERDRSSLPQAFARNSLPRHHAGREVEQTEGRRCIGRQALQAKLTPMGRRPVVGRSSSTEWQGSVYTAPRESGPAAIDIRQGRGPRPIGNFASWPDFPARSRCG